LFDIKHHAEVVNNWIAQITGDSIRAMFVADFIELLNNRVESFIPTNLYPITADLL